MSKQFDKVGAVNAALRVGLAQATADLVQDQMEETVTLVAEVADQSEQALAAAAAADAKAQEAIDLVSSLSGLPADVIQAIIDLINGSGGGGGGGGGLEGVQRVGPGAGHWGVSNLEQYELILTPSDEKFRWLGGINRGVIDPLSNLYWSVQDYYLRSANLATGVVEPDSVITGWTSDKNYYRHVVAISVTAPLALTILLSAGRNAETPFTVLAKPNTDLVPPTFAEMSIAPGVPLPIADDFAYPNRGVAGVNLSTVFLPYAGTRVLIVGPTGALPPADIFVSAGRELDVTGLGIDPPDALLMSQGVLIPGTSTVLSTCWVDEAPLRGALVQISTDFTNPATVGLPLPVLGGVLRIYDDKHTLVETRTFSSVQPVRLVSDMLSEAVALAAHPSAMPLTFEDSHREAVFDPSSGAVVLVPANDRHVYLILWNAAEGTAEVERHPITGVGQLGRRWKWGAAVYVPERQAVVCAPAAHSHVLEISGKGTAFRTRSLLAFPAASDQDAILFSDIVYQGGKIHMIPRELSSSKIISLPADFDPDEPYLVTL
jgi:hypothetical protein